MSISNLIASHVLAEGAPDANVVFKATVVTTIGAVLIALVQPFASRIAQKQKASLPESEDNREEVTEVEYLREELGKERKENQRKDIVIRKLSRWLYLAGYDPDTGKRLQTQEKDQAMGGSQ